MAQVINTNIASLNAQRNLNTSQSALSISLQRLSSGLRINSAKDDAAGLAISERFTSQIRAWIRPAAMPTTVFRLRKRQKAHCSPRETSSSVFANCRCRQPTRPNSAGDRSALNSEVQQLTQELQRIATTTEFNGQRLLDGSFSSAIFQVGANANQTITANSGNFRTAAYGNYRIGALVADKETGIGDLVKGSISADGTQTNRAQMSRINAGSSIINTAGAIDLNTASGTTTVRYNVGASAAEIAASVNASDAGVRASAVTNFVLGGAADQAAPAAGATTTGRFAQGKDLHILSVERHQRSHRHEQAVFLYNRQLHRWRRQGCRW